MNLHTKCCEPGDVGGDRRDLRVERRYVHLQSHAIDGNAPALEIFDHGVDRVRLAVQSFTLGLVVEQQRVRIRLMCPAKHLLDVGCSFLRPSDAGLVVPQGIAHISVLIQAFVDHIPREDLAPIVLHHPGDVFAQKARQLPGRKVTLRQPIGVVTAPDQAMAADLHLVGLREANHLVALAKVVGGLIRPQDRPLHRVFRLHHAELASQRGGVGSLRKL